MLGLPLLISTFSPRKIDDLSFSGFQSQYRIFNAFQSILLRILYMGISLYSFQFDTSLINYYPIAK